MKNKYFVLLTICSLFCILGCSCKREQPQGGSSDTASTESTSQEQIVIKKEPNISLNQDSVTLGLGESYTLTATVTNVENPIFVWAVDGDYPEDVISLSQANATASITALKVGETKVILSMEYDGHVYFKSVLVTVKENSDVALVLSEDIGFDDNGYHIDLSTLPTAQGDETSIAPLVTAYKNNKIVPIDSFTWQSENSNVVKIDGNKFVSVGEGDTNIIGVGLIGGEEHSVKISVNVYRPTIQLTEKFVVELENLSTLNLVSAIKGTVKDVLYNGESVGVFNTHSKTISLTKSKLPTDAASMGENRQLWLETSLARYTINIDLYTLCISNKAEFDNMANLSKKACVTNAALWDGYFVLDDNITYNDLFKSKIADLDSLWAAVGGSWSNGGLYGFKGVFDGKGHKIEGIRIDSGNQLGAIFGVLHIDGVVKNVSFINASVAANSGLVCGAGGGSIENVYIKYTSMGKGTQHYEGDGSVNTHCGSFFSFKEPTATANVSNCIIDVTEAELNVEASIKIVGSEYASIKNVFVIGGTKALQAASNATLAFDSIIDFVEDSNAQSRYKKFDSTFWALEGGAGISNSIYNDVCGLDVHFIETTESLLSGTSYKFVLDNQYVKITSNNPNVTITNGVAYIAESIVSGETVTITATSIFDNTKQASFTCTLVAADANT